MGTLACPRLVSTWARIWAVPAVEPAKRLVEALPARSFSVWVVIGLPAPSVPKLPRLVVMAQVAPSSGGWPLSLRRTAIETVAGAVAPKSSVDGVAVTATEKVAELVAGGGLGATGFFELQPTARRARALRAPRSFWPIEGVCREKERGKVSLWTARASRGAGC